MSDRAIEAAPKDQPDNLVWNCPYCGLFTSTRTRPNHQACYMAMAEADSGYHWQYGVVQGRGSR